MSSMFTVFGCDYCKQEFMVDEGRIIGNLMEENGERKRSLNKITKPNVKPI